MTQLYEQCYKRKFKRNVSGNCHITCINPDINMTGNPHGINNGWFWYPVLFDPIWGTKKCDNFEELP